MRICNVPDCENTNIAAHGMCWKHYRRAKRNNGDVSDPDWVNKGKECSEPDCKEPAKNRGLCIKHYVRWINHGNTQTTLRPSTYDGHVCIVRGCDIRPRSDQLCHNHYYAYRFHYRKGKVANPQEYVNFLERKESK